ncbi:MAG: hypothetical protein K6A82_07385 [Prevotella sp.]|nr:hypothetical protein [Prevotella sp.]
MRITKLVPVFVLLMLPLVAFAQELPTHQVTISLKELIKNVSSETVHENSMSPYVDRKGYDYHFNYGDWNVEVEDALVDETNQTLDLFNGGKIRINGKGVTQRMEKLTFASFQEVGDVYLFDETNNGKVTKDFSKNEGNDTYTDVVWTPQFPSTIYRVEFFVQGKHRTDKGKMTLTGDIIIEYTESESFQEKKYVYPHFERPSIDVTINQNIITEPTLAVYDDSFVWTEEHDVTRFFNFVYHIEGEPVKDINYDTETQSSVFRHTGEVRSGGKKGSFKVIATPVPKDETASRLYLPTEISYTVNVHGKEGVVSMNGSLADKAHPSELRLYQGVPVKAPAFKVMDPTGVVDLSQYYKMSLADVRLEMLAGSQNIVESLDGGKNIKGTIQGTATARMTFSPKDEYVTLYDAAAITVKVTVLPRPLDAGAKVILSSTELEGDNVLRFKRNSVYYNELVVKVYDNLGNDVSDYYNFDPQAVRYSLTNNTGMDIDYMAAKEAARLNREHASDPDFVPAKEGDPEFHTSSRTGSEMLTIDIPKKSSSPDIFKNVTKQATIIIGAKTPDVRIMPKKITLRVGQTWNSNNPSNPFDLHAYVDLRSLTDEYDNIYYNTSNPNEGITVTPRQSRSNYGTRWNPYYITQTTSFSVRGEKVGNYNIKVTVSPIGSHFDPVTVDWPVEVVAKIKPTVTFSAGRSVVRHGQKVIEPVLKITDSNGEDISDQYTVRYTAILDNRYWGTEYILENAVGRGQSAYSSDGKIKTDLLPDYDGTYAITATVTPKNPTDYEGGSATYELLVYQAKWGYRIDNTAQSATYGSLDFTSPGDMLAGSIIDGVPGLSVQFGAVGADDWDVRSDGADIYATSPNEPITLDPNRTVQATVATVKDDKTVFSVADVPYLPTGGSFIRFVPAADGFIQADMEWQAGHTYVLVRYRGDKVERLTYTPAVTRREVHRFSNAVYGGYAGYFYDSTEGGHMKIYGFNFIPAYILTAHDKTETTRATAYLNWAMDEQGVDTKLMKKVGLPWLVHKASPYVQHLVEQGYEGYVTVNQEGVFDLLQTTDGIAQGAHPSSMVQAHQALTRENGTDGQSEVPEKHVRVYGKVISAEDPSIYRLAWYDMMITGIPSYQVPEDYTPSVQEQVTSVPGITMTWGGWRRYDNIDYKYDENGEVYDIQDAWQKSQTDKVASESGILEGYLYASVMGGNSYAKDEMAKEYKPGGESFDSNGGIPVSEPYMLPCRGDYVTFKPSKAGTLYVYVLQEGCVEWNGDEQVNPGKNNMIRWSPLYILDERDNAVELRKTTDVEEYSAQMSSANGYLTRSRYLCSPYTSADYSGGKGRGYDRESNTMREITNFKYMVEFKDGLTPSRLDFLKSNWGNYGTPQKVLDMDEMDEYKNSGRKTGGHLMISKGYVRYTFDVLPGKTYYVFQTGAKMGLAGFAFDAQADHKETDVTLESSTTQSFLNSNEQQVRHADLTLKGKKLIKDHWNAITLPFSMNEEQVQQTFGSGTVITVFNDVDENAGTSGRIYFTEHRYQHIVAGQPCMVWPTFVNASGSMLEGVTLKHDDKHDMDYVDEVEIDDIAIDRTKNELRELKSKKSPGYTMQGLYEVSSGKEINKGDYYMSWGTLIHSNYGNQSGTFNAILRGKPDIAPAKLSMVTASFLDEVGMEVPTGIEEIETDHDRQAAPSGVYNLQGQKVADEWSESLAPGVYIVDGKKLIVK